MSKQKRPELRQLSRRRFLAKVLGLGVSATAGMVAISVLDDRNSEMSNTDSWTARVPVRNPAFTTVPADRPGHRIAYCMKGEGEYVAWEMNASGVRIWEACTDHFDFVDGRTCRGSEVASAVADELEAQTVFEYLGLLEARGLIYAGDASARVYFEHWGPS